MESELQRHKSGNWLLRTIALVLARGPSVLGKNRRKKDEEKGLDLRGSVNRTWRRSMDVTV